MSGYNPWGWNNPWGEGGLLDPAFNPAVGAVPTSSIISDNMKGERSRFSSPLDRVATITTTPDAGGRAFGVFKEGLGARGLKGLSATGLAYGLGAPTKMLATAFKDGFIGNGSSLVGTAMGPINAAYGFGPKSTIGKWGLNLGTGLLSMVNPALGALGGMIGPMAYTGVMDGLDARINEGWKDGLEDKYGWGSGNMIGRDIEDRHLDKIKDRSLLDANNSLSKAASVHALRSNVPNMNPDARIDNINAMTEYDLAAKQLAAFDKRYREGAKPSNRISRAITRNGWGYTSHMDMSKKDNFDAMADAIGRRGRSFFSDETLSRYDQARRDRDKRTTNRSSNNAGGGGGFSTSTDRSTVSSEKSANEARGGMRSSMW